MSKYLQLVMFMMTALASDITWAGKVTNKLPTVSLTSPSTGATFIAPASITLTASASDSDGTVSKVDFYLGSSLVGTKASSPYTVTLTNVAAGSYSLTARATDNSNTSSTSSAVSFTVSGAAKIVITSPANGAIVYGGKANVSGTFSGDSNTSIWINNGQNTYLAKVEGNVFSALFPVVPGPNTLTITVVRRDKTFDTTTIIVNGADYPKIAFTSPSTSTFNAPANVMLAVDALSPNGIIDKISLFNGDTLLSTLASAPYQFSWNNVQKGEYLITAKAFDKLGYSSSASTSVSVLGANSPPAISLTSPSNNAVFGAPAAISMTAISSDSDGTVALVEFLQNGTLLGAFNLAPYTFNWTNVPTGSYTLTARATDNSGAQTDSAPISVTVTPPNIPPTVSLTSPTSGASFIAPAAIMLGANAGDSDGTITKVEFYQGITLIGAAIAAPYSFNWTNVAAGSYSVTAKATDNLGSTMISAPVAVTVNTNTAPIINLVSPVQGNNVMAPATVTLTATATDNDGSISKVEFFQGITLIGAVTIAPYSYTWANVPAGSYSVTAKATDNLGSVTTSTPVAVTIYPNIAPTVSLTSPAASANLEAPASIALAASAADNDGSIAKVDFFQGATLIGTALNPPYKYTWINVAAGSYSITAKATDNLDAVTTSEPVAITVKAGPQLVLTAPANNAVLAGDSVLVKGSFQGPANIGITVNGVIAALDTNNHFYAHVPLTAGANTITAMITTQTGNTSTQSINVNSDGVAPAIQISADRVEGIAPFTANFSVEGTGAMAGNISVSGGTASVTNNGNIINVTYPNPGTYPTTISATDAQGNAIAKSYVVVVQSETVVDQKFNALWNGMNNALISGDKTTAMSYLTPQAQAKFGPIFDALMPQMSAIFASSSPLKSASFSQGVSEYAINRTIDGVNTIFFIYFLQDDDGVWHLDSM